MTDETDSPPSPNPVDPTKYGTGSYNGPPGGDVVDCSTCEVRISRVKWWEEHSPSGHQVLGNVYVPTLEEQPA